MLTAWKNRHRSVSGHQGRYPMRKIVNSILYQSRTGFQWALLPNDLPPKSDVLPADSALAHDPAGRAGQAAPPQDTARLLDERPTATDPLAFTAFLAALTGHWHRNARQPAPPASAPTSAAPPPRESRFSRFA